MKFENFFKGMGAWVGRHKRFFYIVFGIILVFLVGYFVFTWKQIGGSV